MELQSFEEAIRKSKEWPSWDELRKGDVYAGGSIRNALREIEINLRRNRLCLIRGSEGRGKTALARKVGYDLTKDGWEVWHLDISTYTEKDMIPELEKFDHEKYLIIIENAHSFLEVAEQLLKPFHKTKNAQYLFTTRLIADNDVFEEIMDKGWYWDIEPDIDTIKGIIGHYKTNLRLASYKPSSEVEIQKWIEENIGSNLRRLRWFLDAWEDKVNTPLHEVNRDKVKEHVYKKIVNPLEPEEQRALFKISAIFQFDVEVHGFSFGNAEGYFAKLCHRGLVYEDSGYYRLAHSTDAVYITEAYAYGKSIKTASTEVCKILQEYFEQSPPNYYQLIVALYVALHRERKRDLLREIILKDATFNAIEHQAKHEPNVGRIFSVLGKINWANNERGKDFWTSFKELLGSNQEEQKQNLLKRFQDVPLGTITNSISFLKQTSEEEARWLADIILKEGSLSQKAEESFFNTILNTIKLFNKLCSKQRVKILIKSLNPISLGKKAKERKRSLKWIGWILKQVHKEYPDFVKNCIREIGEKNLFDVIKTSSPHQMNRWFTMLEQIDPALKDRIKKQLSPDDWLNFYTYYPFGSLMLGKLYRLVETNRSLAKEVVKALAKQDLICHMEKLYERARQDKSISPLRNLGKFLYCVWRTGDIDAAKKIADQIAKGTNFSCNYTLEEVSRSIFIIRKCGNPSALVAILAKVTFEVPLESFITSPLDRGLPYIIWELYNSESTKSYSVELENKIMHLNFENLLKQSEPHAVSLLIWNMLQIDMASTLSWVCRDKKLWIEKIKYASTTDAFWLLWSLYQVDGNLSKEVAIEGVMPMLNSIKELAPEDLPLLGLLGFFEITISKSLDLDPDVLADELSKNPGATEIFFVIRFLSKKAGLVAQRLIQELTKYLFCRYPKYSLDGLKEACPLEEASEVFEKILDRSVILKEMISFTQAYMRNRNSRSVKFGELIYNFSTAPNGKPLFKTRGMATEWIRMATEEGIYRMKTVPHRKIQGSSVSWISLDYSNPIVSSVVCV
jgi:archaellum biogenesis ATPase FlaH